MIDQIHHRRAVDFDSIAHGHRRMVQELSHDARSADRMDTLGQVVICDGGRQLIQVDREIRELHLAGQHVMQRRTAAFRTIDRNRVSFDECRDEERKPLDMIPVRMPEENVGVDRLLALCHQLAANPRAPVPQSRIRSSPLAVVSSTQEVLPPSGRCRAPAWRWSPSFPKNGLSLSLQLLCHVHR